MMPASDECYKSGCIRDHIKPGEKLDFCSAIHSEVNIIAMAARDGVSIKGATLYVTHFPCPRCAKVIAKSGIKKVVYHQGWSNFDGEEVMRLNNIELIKINVEP
jgi:dCMP deaminase